MEAFQAKTFQSKPGKRGHNATTVNPLPAVFSVGSSESTQFFFSPCARMPPLFGRLKKTKKKVSCKEVRTRELPELNDEFADSIRPGLTYQGLYDEVRAHLPGTQR